MESPPSPSSQIIDISVDVPDGVPTVRASKLCAGNTCDFSETRSSPKDVKERFTSMRKLLIAVILCVIFMSVEVVGGIKANSLAILTDAAHLLSDVAAFAISLFSLWASGWEATPQQSYGFFRIEILGALVSIQLIWLLTGILVYEAIDRLIHDTGEVQGVLMFAVAAFGLVVNIVMAVLLGHDHGHGGHGHHHGHDHGHGGHGHHHGHDGHGHHHGHDGHGHDHGHSGHEHDHDHSHSDDELSHHHDEHSHHDHFHIHDEDLQHHDHVVRMSSPHHHKRNYANDGQLEPLLKHPKEAHTGHSSSKETKKKPRNINVHSAYLHVLGDSIQSVGVMIGGAIIWWKPEWKIIDLICTLIFSVIVLVTTVKMLRNILEVLMESTPREIDATELERGLCALDGIVAVHELHVWAITVGKVLLACHVTITPDANADLVLDTVISYIKKEYNISHVTIQIERL